MLNSSVQIIQNIFYLAASAVSLYTTICFIRILIAWFPGANYSPVGKFLSQLCDPYMNMFYRIPLRIGMFDFTPILSLGLLTMLSSLLKEIGKTGRIYVAGILSNIVLLLWNAVSTIGIILFLIFFVRYCVAIFSKSSNNYDSPWQALDRYISNTVFKISKPFSFGKPNSYKNALLISSFVLFLSLIAGNILIEMLINIIAIIPF